METMQDMENSQLIYKLRDKWREVPASTSYGERMFSDALVELSDAQLFKLWSEQYEQGKRADARGWYYKLYADFMTDRAVIELGSGLGFDGIHFAREHGTRWTFADLVPSNLEIIQRICNYLAMDYCSFVLIDDVCVRLPADYDAVWSNGSVHHAPFEFARQECRSVIKHLRQGGRWIEMCYPYSRWVREGCRPFSEWGKMTDGDRTPWAEWYDIQKLKRRLFPATFETVLDFELAASNNNFAWFDMCYIGDRSEQLNISSI